MGGEKRAAAMYGEDSSGRKVSLLNDTTIPPHNIFPRPKLPSQSGISTSSLSSSSRSREGGYTSSRSSISCSPRHSPPTPPLVRLDSRSSLTTASTPSPMTPNYGFEPMDQQSNKNTMNNNNNINNMNNNNNNNNGGMYYGNFSRHNGNPFPSLQDVNQQPYYNLSNQQPMHPMNGAPSYDFDETYSQRTTLNRIQSGSLPINSDPNLTQLSSTNNLHNNLHNSINGINGINGISNNNNNNNVVPSHSSILPNNNTPTTATSNISTDRAISSAPIKTDPSTPITSSSNPANNKTPLSKKKYPCPHASRFSCTDTFTTSGHAARHGKKHTGEKNILCPTCNKAFTRKDNMKQHERTHKGGNRSGGASPSMSDKGKGSGGSIDGNMDVDPITNTEPRPKMMRSELSEILESVGKGQEGSADDMDADGEGESPGLDALAAAASGEMV